MALPKVMKSLKAMNEIAIKSSKMMNKVAMEELREGGNGCGRYHK